MKLEFEILISAFNFKTEISIFSIFFTIIGRKDDLDEAAPTYNPITPSQPKSTTPASSTKPVGRTLQSQLIFEIENYSIGKLNVLFPLESYIIADELHSFASKSKTKQNTRSLMTSLPKFGLVN